MNGLVTTTVQNTKNNEAKNKVPDINSLVTTTLQ